MSRRKAVRRIKTLAERLWPKIDQTGGPDACWPWQGAKTERGYGLIRIGEPGAWRMQMAHRAAYIETYGPIDDSLVVRHLVCDNPPCCNPSHLTTGTKADNYEDAKVQGRHSHGEQHGNSKLSDEAVAEIRKLRATGLVYEEIADRFSVHLSQVAKICARKLWKHVA